MPSTVQTDMRLHFSTTIFIYFSPATNCMVGAKTLHVNKGSNVASMVKSELLSKDLFGGKWSSEDIEFAIKDLVVPGTGSEKIDLALRPVSSFDENSTYSLGDGVKRPMIRSKQVLVSTDPDKVFSAVSVDLETQKTFGFFQSGIGKEYSGTTNGKVFNLSQEKGMAIQVEQSAEFNPPAWHCSADQNEFQIASVVTTDEVTHDERGGHASATTLSNDEDQRRLDRAHEDAHHTHRHPGHFFDHASETEPLSAIGKSLRGSQNKFGRRVLYYTDDYPKAYTYQVNLYVRCLFVYAAHYIAMLYTKLMHASLARLLFRTFL